MEVRIRNNDQVKRGELLREISQLVGYPHLVDLRRPRVSVLVEVFNVSARRLHLPPVLALAYLPAENLWPRRRGRLQGTQRVQHEKPVAVAIPTEYRLNIYFYSSTGCS